MGMPRDMSAQIRLSHVDDLLYWKKVQGARKFIYTKNLSINSKPVEGLLKEESLAPVANAFSDRLSAFGFNFFQILVVDILHDWEIGNHPIRFRATPTFGRDTIRKFSANTSEMKKLAAHNYEDILQVLAFGHYVLFACATWHGLAKLRIHNDLTLAALDEATTMVLGTELRNFVSSTCTSFETRELPCEADAHARHATNGKKNTSQVASGRAQPSAALGATTRRLKTLNLDTYKFHALGDVLAHIREFGTTDSYSTEIGELEHQTVKAWYKRTDRKEYTKQVAPIERLQARLHWIEWNTWSLDSFKDNLTVTEVDGAEVHHFIGKTENLPVHIGQYVNQHFGDPAIEIQAILGREAMLHEEPPVPNDSDDWLSVLLRQDQIYEDNIMRLHYTSYDVRRSADVIHIKTSHCNIMLLNPDFNGNPDTDHPYLYARVLGIYHANIVYSGHRDNPSDILQGCHLIPHFSHGKAFSPVVDRNISSLAKGQEDWKCYYINHADCRFKPILEESLSDNTLDEDLHVNQPLDLSPIQELELEPLSIGGNSDAEYEDDLDDDDMVFNEPELGSDGESVTGNMDDDREDEYWTDVDK
ncbi:hypothetical protein DXG01_002238 [Tephrocybe rancida]|nr:hypothetical protein DXG01_002238 [Tephrocybe rancida]